MTPAQDPTHKSKKKRQKTNRPKEVILLINRTNGGHHEIPRIFVMCFGVGAVRFGHFGKKFEK